MKITEKREIATKYFRAEYGPDVAADVVAEVVADLSAAELDGIVASVKVQPWLTDVDGPVLIDSELVTLKEADALGRAARVKIAALTASRSASN